MTYILYLNQHANNPTTYVAMPASGDAEAYTLLRVWKA